VTDTVLVGAVVLSLLFALTNGMKDGANVFATAVSSRSLTFRQALWLVALAEFCGPFLFGIPVALTVARGIIRVELLPRDISSLLLVLSGIAGALLWNGFCWLLRLPTSSSFALIGGLIGPVLFRYGLSGIPWTVFLLKVVGALLLSPFLGILFGSIVHQLLVRILENAPWKTAKFLKRLQIGSVIVLGMNHGTNDSQKTMGLIALLLFLSGQTQRMDVPLWVMVASVASLSFGVTMGGTKIIRTVGYNIFRVRPYHSFSAQLAASIVLLGCNLSGAPVSTTQIISSSVIGVGSAHRRRAVRWQVIRSILLAWIFTIPLAGVLSILLYLIFRQIIPII
jgi:PiT family inorganic phosphate transporter